MMVAQYSQVSPKVSPILVIPAYRILVLYQYNKCPKLPIIMSARKEIANRPFFHSSRYLFSVGDIRPPPKFYYFALPSSSSLPILTLCLPFGLGLQHSVNYFLGSAFGDRDSFGSNFSHGRPTKNKKPIP